MLSIFLVAANCQFSGHFGSFYCRILSNRDCDLDPKDLQCGTDGVTYDNQCYYTKARCQGIHADIAHYGSCTPTSNNQTLPGFDGDQAVLDYLCVQLSHQECPTTVDEVCASDNVTYQNLCEFEKQRCTHRTLHIKSQGACSS
ncbi:follistatin-related protein 3 [Patella vulgata]|uniref:follistatin-related protein 3 n=1 Tax=Patella vulgata TaxID=6465 RepID=UPI00217F5F96|nr:follistatin-related protein 3 [Patella vulgata]